MVLIIVNLADSAFCFRVDDSISVLTCCLTFMTFVLDYIELIRFYICLSNFWGTINLPNFPKPAKFADVPKAT